MARTPQRSSNLRHQANQLLWGVLEQGSAQDYAPAMKDGVEKKQFTANEALTFPLTRAMEQRLGNMPHDNPLQPGVPRDQRLKIWFQEALDLGANPRDALSTMAEHAAGGFTRLIKMKCFGALGWWREQGVEMHFPGPVVLHREPTTFTTLACLHGNLEGVHALLPGSQLTHVHTLWRRAWSKPCVEHSDKLTAFLQTQSAPPRNCLAEMAGAPVNVSNVDGVLASGSRLIKLGCDINAPDSDGLLPLERAAKAINSPASLAVISFLLDMGADPAVGSTSKSALEVALIQWMKCSTRSHLRSVHMACFMKMARVCSKEQLDTLFPSERKAEIETTLRGHISAPRPFSTADIPWDPNVEVAQLQALWMEVAQDIKPIARGARARL